MPSLFSHFHLLHRRDYAFYFLGQMLSMSGTFMQRVVQAWLVYRLTDSSFWLGLIAFIGQFPAFVASPFAGVIADHFDRRKILLTVQFVGLIQAALLAALTMSGHVDVWHIVILSCILGVTDAFELTSRHSFAIEMVGKSELPSAIALNAFILNTAKIVGPLVGGLLIPLVGEGWCFALNSVSYLAVMASILQFASSPRRSQSKLQILASLKEGFRYVKTIPSLHFPLLFATFLGFIGSPYIVLLPIFAKNILHGDSTTLGWLTAFHSAGALIGAVSAVEKTPRIEVRHLLIRRMLSFALCLGVFSISTQLWISSLAIGLCGYFLIGCYPMINNALQFLVADHMRSRVLSLYTMTFLGTLPISGFLAGLAADIVPAPWVLLAVTLLCILLGSWLLKRRGPQMIHTSHPKENNQ